MPNTNDGHGHAGIQIRRYLYESIYITVGLNCTWKELEISVATRFWDNQKDVAAGNFAQSRTVTEHARQSRNIFNTKLACASTGYIVHIVNALDCFSYFSAGAPSLAE